jgi:nitric oxide reductase FlRd-NAD(+) reductase
MINDIVIIGSGFAARQLVKNLRKLDQTRSIHVIARDSCDEYNKPDLSHVFSQGVLAEELTRERGADWAEKNHIILHPHTEVLRINRTERCVETSTGNVHYGKLVLATGAEAIRPQVPGSELMYTLNSQQDYYRCGSSVRDAKRVLLVGGGLIGTELAMDLNRANKEVTLIDRATCLLPALLPQEIAARLQNHLTQANVTFRFKTELLSLVSLDGSIVATFNDLRQYHFDAVLCAIGLRPDTSLAEIAGLEVNRGIVVDNRLRTSDPDIFALGDCAEIQGKLLPYLQPALMAAMTLAKCLTGPDVELTLPRMLVKVKTPDLPLHLAGDTGNASLKWVMEFDKTGIVAKGFDDMQKLRAFVVSEDHISQAFNLMKTLS